MKFLEVPKLYCAVCGHNALFLGDNKVECPNRDCKQYGIPCLYEPNVVELKERPDGTP